MSFVINLATTPTSATLRGLQRYDITNAITVANVLATAVLTVVILQTGGGLIGMVALTIPVSIVTQLVAAMVVRRVQPELGLHLSPASRAEARRLTRFGATLTVSQFAVLLQKRSCELIIGVQLSAAAVAPFSLARRLSDLLHVISDQFIKVLLPVASELHTEENQTALRKLYLASTRVSLALIVPLALAISLLAGDLLELLVGEDYRKYAHLVVVLVGTSVAFTSQWPAGAVFQGMGRFGAFAGAALVSGVATVVLTLWWVGPYGLTGVVMGTLVPTTAEALFFTLPYTVVKLKVAWRELWHEVVVPVVVPAVASAAVLVLAGRWGGDASWLGISLTCLSSGFVFGVLYLAFPASSQERGLVLAVLRRAGCRLIRQR